MKCPRCKTEMIWQSDYSFEDYGYDKDGVVSLWDCPNCGVDIEIYIPSEQESDADEGSVP